MAESRPQSPLAAVIGHPVHHSISPLIFDYLARKSGREIHYRRIDIPPAKLRKAFTVARDLGLFTGWNCTIPHKEAIARLADRRSPEVECLGAANVVEFKAGSALAFNTDVLGVIRTLVDRKIPIRNACVVVLGAGGAALAVGYALGSLGAREVHFVNRTRSRAQKVARKLGARFKKTDFRATDVVDLAQLVRVELYVNSTPLGMAGFENRSVLPRRVTPGAWAFDLIYRPEHTVFLKDAARLGLKTVGGLDMLIWQALATWEIWFGPLGSRARVRRIFLGVRGELRKHLKEEPKR